MIAACLLLTANQGVSYERDVFSNGQVALTVAKNRPFSFRALSGGPSLTIREPFRVVFRDGHKLDTTKWTGRQPGHRSNSGPSARQYVDPATGLRAILSFGMRPGTSYVREALVLHADRDVDIAEITLGDGPAASRVEGKVSGSPVIAGNFFVGLEHPMSEAMAGPGGWSVKMRRKLPLRRGQSVTYSSVFGVAAPGQMRRTFLAYLEKERPRPYNTFLHYNSWYDLGYFNRYTADQCVERINTVGKALTDRHVHLSSYLFDDGWDDPKTVWKFNSDFPNDFFPLKQAAAKYNAAPGIWLSPWGGYGQPRDQRLKTGKAEGYEIDSQGYALSGPKYYARFHDVCLDLVRNDGINQFKFDGTGSPDKQYPGSAFASDFEAAISLIHDLREAKPGLFVNLTTGTWPSPFWTRYADSIWRGGSDHEFAGDGPWREKWMTYRDGDTYHGIVERGALYPLNSLMLHGIIYAQHARNLSTDPSDSFRNEVRSYFGSGTQLQELYITPNLLTKRNWDDLAAAANWSYANRDALVDTHWVGGDPTNGEVYGWAAWNPRRALLTLRNPSPKPQAFSIDPRKVFELPASTKGRYDARDPYGPDRQTMFHVDPGAAKVVLLKPFEVRVYEGVAR